MLLLAFLLGCSDITVTEIKQPEIIVAPSTLEFGHLLSGYESDMRTITIANGGTDDLVVNRLEVIGSNYAIDTSGFTVPSGGWHQIEVSYAPATFEHNQGYVDIYLEGEESPSESVWLDGHGDAPVINLSPIEIDFGAPLLGCEARQEIAIQNDGNIDLIVDDISFMSSVPQEIELVYGTLPAFPWTLPPLTRLSFFVDYVPMDETYDQISYDVTSNDPTLPSITSSAIGDAVLSNEIVQSWIQQTAVIVDIIWVIDNSGSMNTFQQQLGYNMQNFMNVFLSYSPDFQIAFITTDSPHFVGRVIDNTAVDPTADSVTIINSIGTRGSGHEKGLEKLKDCMNTGECVSFMRPNATLVAIFLSDEPDGSSWTTQAFTMSFDSIKPNMFVPYAIIGDVPGGCSSTTSNRFAQAGHGYWDIVNHYGSSWWSICDSDWGSQLEDVAQAVSIQTTFPLDSEDPVVDTIRVFINGQQVEGTWTYDPASNAVVFDYDNAPEAGDLLEVSYSSWGCGN